MRYLSNLKTLDELAAQARELNMGYEDGRTHHEKCWEDHADCARIHLRAALARVAELEKILSVPNTAVFSMGDALRNERDEVHRLKADLAAARCAGTPGWRSTLNPVSVLACADRPESPGWQPVLILPVQLDGGEEQPATKYIRLDLHEARVAELERAIESRDASLASLRVEDQPAYIRMKENAQDFQLALHREQDRNAALETELAQAQMVEHRTDNAQVSGSIPDSPTTTADEARLREWLQGCGAHTCFVRQGPLSGMGTNGRCRCGDMHNLRAVPDSIRTILDALAAANARVAELSGDLNIERLRFAAVSKQNEQYERKLEVYEENENQNKNRYQKVVEANGEIG